mgnify:CR=1 FL=1
MLAIRTSPGMRPNLEAFDLVTEDTIIRSYGLANVATETRTKTALDESPWKRDRVPKDSYFEFEVVGPEIHVTFQPDAIALLENWGTVSWIDWYRH